MEKFVGSSFCCPPKEVDHGEGDDEDDGEHIRKRKDVPSRSRFQKEVKRTAESSQLSQTESTESSQLGQFIMIKFMDRTDLPPPNCGGRSRLLGSVFSWSRWGVLLKKLMVGSCARK